MAERPWSLADPAEYRRLPLRAHELLRGVPLHDVWRVDLPHHGAEHTINDIRTLLSLDSLTPINPAVRALFALRGWMGRVFGWDSDERPSLEDPELFLHRLTEDDRAQSLVEPGTADLPFTILYVRTAEAVGEIRNATVHAFSVLALDRRSEDYRIYWGIHVRPVGRVTAFYMALIDPFRRWIIYPSILRHVHRTWCARMESTCARPQKTKH